MTSVPLNPNTTDEHYRYRRPKIVVKYENTYGISTRLLNLAEIAAALTFVEMGGKRAATQARIEAKIVAAIKKQMGVSVIYKPGDLVFKGRVEVAQLETELNKWIVKAVLCPKCSSPEYGVALIRPQEACRACGYSLADPKTSKPVDPSAYEVKVASVEDDATNLEQATYLHRLYTRRDTMARPSEQLKIINRVLDKIWSCPSEEHWTTTLKPRVEAYLQEVS